VDEPLVAVAISSVLNKDYRDVFVCKPV